MRYYPYHRSTPIPVVILRSLTFAFDYLVFSFVRCCDSILPCLVVTHTIRFYLQLLRTSARNRCLYAVSAGTPAILLFSRYIAPFLYYACLPCHLPVVHRTFYIAVGLSPVVLRFLPLPATGYVPYRSLRLRVTCNLPLPYGCYAYFVIRCRQALPSVR